MVRCWQQIEGDGSGGYIEDPLDNLLAEIRQRQLDTLIIQFNFSFFGTAPLTQLLHTLHQEGVRVLVYEAAILFETGGDAGLDLVVVVDAPVETRIARTMARDGADRPAVLARMRHQMDPAEARRRADRVVENDGDLAALRAEADRLAAELLGP